MQSNKIKLMAHLVAGYPTDEVALDIANALVAGGADILEVQLPFSDPSADGVAIQNACCKVLERGYKTQAALALIAKIHEANPQTPIYIMSYGSLVFTPGVENFCKMAKGAGAAGLIVPDLPYDCDEGLRAACADNGLFYIPVVAPSMTRERLGAMTRENFPYIYAALRVGITGSATKIDEGVTDFLRAVSKTGAKIYGGFGIQRGEQSRAVAPYVEAVVAGSAFVRIISENAGDKVVLLEKVQAKAKELSRGE